MDEINNRFEETSETEQTRNVEQQSLDDATLEPNKYIEQNSDIQQTEGSSGRRVQANGRKPFQGHPGRVSAHKRRLRHDVPLNAACQ